MSASQSLSTTHVLVPHQLVLYKRERSSVWQCRFNVNGRWQRTTTGERDELVARKRAHNILIEANVKLRLNVAPITRSFKNMALAAMRRMRQELEQGIGKIIYNDYIAIFEKYLIPFFGKHNVNNITPLLLAEYEAWRDKRMQKSAKRSTVQTHNAAINRVLDEAEIQGFLHATARPKLVTKGKQGKRRVEFTLDEIRKLKKNFDKWITQARADCVSIRELLRDYVYILLDTGARPGKELLDLKWIHIELKMFPQITKTGIIDQTEGANEEILLLNANKTVFIKVLTGKTSAKGGRTIVGRLPTVKALDAIASRNYGKTLSELIRDQNTEYVFTYREYVSERQQQGLRDADLVRPKSLNKLFDEYLMALGLLIDNKTTQRRVFYSLRHAYATLALTHDKVAIHTLAKQMGTSVTMIEKHYSHLDAVKAVNQLRGVESRQLIESDYSDTNADGYE